MAWKASSGETPIDPSGLRIRGVFTRRQLDPYEAENIRRATVKYLARKPTCAMARFDLSWAKKLHREMFGRVWKWAGKFRTRDFNVGVPWAQIEMSLDNLLINLPLWAKTGVEIMEQAAMLHHKAVFIHPFENGNGRWSRLLANIWLKRHDVPPTEWPEQTIGKESVIRSDYLAAIKAADDGDYSTLLALQRRFTRKAK